MELLSVTIISCSQAIQIFDRLQNVIGLSPRQKIEVITEIRKVIPTCPIIIKNETQKQTTRSN
jgi:hypothetical protein